VLEIKIIQPRDFLKITAQGHYEFGRGKQLIEQLARLNKPPNDGKSAGPDEEAGGDRAT